MKRILTLLPLLLLAASLHAQIVNIPDANFKNALIASNCVDTNDDGIPDSDADLNNDGEIQVSEAAAAPNLYLNEKSIVSMEGLQSFVNIEILYCANNYFATIDLSQNVNLHTLACGWNDFLNALDVSNNTQLSYLDCSVVPNLASLDVTQNTNLVLLYCYYNQLETLDVTQNVNLEYLSCGANELTTLDVSQNSMLLQLGCSYALLPYVDVTNNLNLTHFYCSSSSLMQLDVTQNINLIELGFERSHMTSVDLSQNTNLIRLAFSETDLTSIDLSQNTALETLVFNYTQFPTIDFSNQPNLRAIAASFTELIELDLSQNTNLEFLRLHGSPSLTSLDIKNGNNEILSYLKIIDNPNLSCVQVDDEVYAYNHPYWEKDPNTVYREDCDLNIDDVEKSQIVLYPNPANNSLMITSEIPVEGELSIIDSQGRMVKTVPASNVIDVSQLKTGMYLLKISSEGQVFVKKFMKN